MKQMKFVLLSSLIVISAACHSSSIQRVPSNSGATDITRERAIEIARPHVKFQPKSITADKTTDSERRVWRVTFRGEPAGEGHPIGEILIVLIDRISGEVVSIAQS